MQSVLQITKWTGFVLGYLLRDKCREQMITGAKTKRKLVMHGEMQGKGQFPLGRWEITQRLCFPISFDT